MARFIVSSDGSIMDELDPFTLRRAFWSPFDCRGQRGFPIPSDLTPEITCDTKSSISVVYKQGSSVIRKSDGEADEDIA